MTNYYNLRINIMGDVLCVEAKESVQPLDIVDIKEVYPEMVQTPKSNKQIGRKPPLND
jgi:hypothetical protein